MSIGNDVVNEIYEYRAPKAENGSIKADLEEIENLNIERASPKCDSAIRENWIKAKYINKSFIKPFEKMRIRIKPINSEARPCGSKLEVLEDGEEDENGQDVIVVEDSNTLLHLSSAHGDIGTMLYALAVNADRNSILDRMEYYTDSLGDERKHNFTGFTPLIKAVHSVSRLHSIYSKC